MHNTAVGKAILAFLPEVRVDEILDRHGLPQQTDRTITTREDLEERLERVRENGYALDREERLTGLTCVAAPIRSDDGGVVGSISVSGPASRLDDDQLTGDLAERVVQTANIIEINVTYS
jgi:DNA-binding IclR family transcriptional regulator